MDESQRIALIAMKDQSQAKARDSVEALVKSYRSILDEHGRDAADTMLLHNMAYVGGGALVGMVLTMVNELATR